MFLVLAALMMNFAFAEGSDAPSEWKPSLKWSGDLRLRMARAKESVDDERNYQQLRARLGLKADVNEHVQARIRLATASSAISSNQTLGDSKDPGMARRSFGLDLAYIDWRFVDAFSGWFGRTANPFWVPAKSQILWDSDLAFEGIAFKWEPKWSRSGMFLNIGTSMISENYKSRSGAAPGEDSVDTGLVGGQFGYVWKGDSWSLTAHAATYYFLNVQNSNITRLDKDAKLDEYSSPHLRYRGNTVFVNDPLLPLTDRKYFFTNEYILREAGVEWKHKVIGIEYTLHIDMVRNETLGSLNRAYEAGVGVKWKWLSLSYAKAKKESDSMLGAFTDSDFNGGGTDNEGSRLSLSAEVSKNVAVYVNQFRADRGIDTVRREYSATQADLIVSF